MKRIACAISAVVLTATLSGCATVVMRGGGGDNLLYPATQGDLAMLRAASDSDGTVIAHDSSLLALCALVDLPISIVTDTIMFPFDLIRRHRHRKQQHRFKEQSSNTSLHGSAGGRARAPASAP